MQNLFFRESPSQPLLLELLIVPLSMKSQRGGVEEWRSVKLALGFVHLQILGFSWGLCLLDQSY